MGRSRENPEFDLNVKHGDLGRVNTGRPSRYVPDSGPQLVYSDDAPSGTVFIEVDSREEFLRKYGLLARLAVAYLNPEADTETEMRVSDFSPKEHIEDVREKFAAELATALTNSGKNSIIDRARWLNDFFTDADYAIRPFREKTNDNLI
jgi:hypothetical protein